MSPAFDAVAFVRDLLKKPTARDVQVKVGASDLCDPCTRCLAEKLVSTHAGTQGRYWMGAVVGTAVHMLLEERAQAVQDYETEARVYLGELPGYGPVKSTSDGFKTHEGVVVDYKTTTKDKLVYIKRAHTEPEDPLEVTKVAAARYKVGSYINQTMLYGLGQENAGHTVERCAIVFICRDGKTDEDIWGFDFPYDRERALAIWGRAVRLWEAIQGGRSPESFASQQHCYRCSTREV